MINFIILSINKREVQKPAKKPTNEVKIYVEIAALIFDKCFLIGEIKEERKWPQELADTLQAEYPDDDIPYAKALSDLRGRILRLKKENITFEEITISESTLELLANFALIPNYKALNRGFKGIRVAFTKKHFSFFNLLRIPDTGILYSIGPNWFYTSDTGNKIEAKATQSIIVESMPGDKLPFWVRVSYLNKNEQPANALFAQIDTESTDVRFLPHAKLFSFFNDCKKA